MTEKTNTWTTAEALAAAILNSGTGVVTAVPGSGVNETLIALDQARPGQFPVSFNEETAYTLAHGAALTGSRAVSIMKSHGLLKAGNSVSDSLYAGTTAGLVVIVFEDKDGHSSDSILDIRPFMEGIGIPYVVPQKEKVCSAFYNLMERSEKSGLPCVLVLDSSEIMERVGKIVAEASLSRPPEYKKDAQRHVLCPYFADYQLKIMQYKKQGLDWRKIPRPPVPLVPDGLPDRWKQTAASYLSFFSQLASLEKDLVTGDTGVSTLFACEPFQCIDITTYYGGSIPLAAGAYLGGMRQVWAVTGDFSFIAAGHLGLLETWQRRIPLKIVIFYNGKAETTGGQVIPEGTLEMLISSYNRYTFCIHDPQNPLEIAEVLEEVNRSDELRIVIADYRDCSPKTGRRD